MANTPVRFALWTEPATRDFLRSFGLGELAVTSFRLNIANEDVVTVEATFLAETHQLEEATRVAKRYAVALYEFAPIDPDDSPSSYPSAKTIDDRIDGGPFGGLPAGSLGHGKPSAVGPSRFMRFIRTIFGLKTAYDITHTFTYRPK